MKKLLLGMIMIAFGLSGCARNNEYQQLKLTNEKELQTQLPAQKTLGIAFGGGGLRGYMHLGVMKALDEHNIKADLVTGTSVGSVAATLYASGQDYSTLEQRMLDFSELDIVDFVISRRGFVNGQDLAEWVNDSIPQEQLSDMPIPIGITATDMTSLESVLIKDGNPGKAAQTSSTIPGVFIPVEHDEHLLVDGGVLNVVPVNYARAMGADIVVGVDIYCGNQPAAENSFMQMQISAFRLLTCRLGEEEINSADIVISPDYEPEGNGLFSSKEDAIDAGYQATLAVIPKLKKLLVAAQNKKQDTTQESSEMAIANATANK